MILTLAYMLCYLFVAWSQFQIVRIELDIVSDTVHTGVEVRRMDSEMSGLVEQPWLQLMCCAVCLLRGRNFR